ncbi:MAG TPA: hypothetical protein VF272_00105 [Candidatus Saccharimonadia bacterium]
MRSHAHSRITPTRVALRLLLALAIAVCIATVMASTGERKVGPATIGTATAQAADISCDDAWKDGNLVAIVFHDIQMFARKAGKCLKASNGSKVFVSYLYGEKTLTKHLYPLCTHVRRKSPIFRATRAYVRQWPWNGFGQGCRRAGIL